MYSTSCGTIWSSQSPEMNWLTFVKSMVGLDLRRHEFSLHAAALSRLR
jgi:hypothetical protein